MKKLFLISILIALMFSVEAQFPNSATTYNANTLSMPLGGIRAGVGMIETNYVDTTAANLTQIKNYSGARIFTTTESAIWIRNTAKTKWVMQLPAGLPIPVGQAWVLSGNTWANDVDDLTFGTLSGNSILFKTRALTRLILDSTGILAESGTTVGLGYDPSNGNRLTQYSGGGGTPIIVSDSAWSLTGNSGTTAGTNFVGTTDNVDLVFKRNSVESGRFGSSGNLTLGLTGTTSGGLGLSGSTSGLISILPQAAAGTYNFNLPTTAGTSGYLLTSAGGVGSPMTWTDPTPYTAVPTWQQTLTAGSTLTANTTVDMSLGVDFIFNDFLTFGATTTDATGTIHLKAPYYDFDDIPNAVGTHALRYNPTNGLVTYADTTTSSTPTWQQTLTAGSTLTGTNTIDGSGGSIYFENFLDYHLSVEGTDVNVLAEIISTNTATNRNSDFYLWADSIVFKPSVGNFHIDSLNYSSNADDSMMVWQPSTGAVGMRAIPSGGSGANTALSNLASVAINTSLLLGTSDAAALGSTTKQWSDLFLAEGGVINWDNGDATLTQSGNTLTLAGADLYTTAVTGSTASLADAIGLTLNSTSFAGAANKGRINMGTTFSFSEYYGSLGIGVLNSTTPLHVKSSGTAYNGLKIENTTNASYARQDWVNDVSDLTQMLLAGSTYNTGIFTPNSASFYNSGAGGTNIGGSHATTGHIRFFTRGTGTANEKARFSSIGNLLIGGTSDPTSSVAGVGIFNGTAPTASITDGTILYSEDVAASSELKVRDEAGNITVLSPHNFSQLGKPSEELAWSYYSEKDGKYITVDMAKAIRTIEELSERVNKLEKELNLKAKPPVKLLYKGKVKK